MNSRAIIGLSIGSGFEAADAVLVQAAGIGLGLTPTITGTARIPFSQETSQAARAAFRLGEKWPAELNQTLGETVAQAARQAATSARCDFRSVQCIGLLARLPECRTGTDNEYPTATPAEWVAEQTGLTVITGFRGRDVTAGGSGQFITPAADYLLARHPTEERVLIHLGSVASVLFIPAGCKVTEIIGFEAGPGTRLLDDITRLGTREREPYDAGGKRAVQGRCLTAIRERWQAHPFVHRAPPKSLPRTLLGMPFLVDAFERSRELGGSLNDLLCTATHFVAENIGASINRWLPPASSDRRVLMSGGGVRNGFLWKLLADQFPEQPLASLSEIGIPSTGRSAAAAAVLAALTLDGVAGNLPMLTGAAGGRLIGRIIPGDIRNWSACTHWMARQTAEYASLGRVA
ncbi:MAG: anhydro-N-acetylmuramic acid kinase [Bacteroidales bacterium]|nr:anhydro-N-acetylmuramic acid kinase [Bacteroidales bacterium]